MGVWRATNAQRTLDLRHQGDMGAMAMALSTWSVRWRGGKNVNVSLPLLHDCGLYG